MVLAAATQGGSPVLQFASAELNANKEVLLVAGRQDRLVPQSSLGDLGAERDTGMLIGVPKRRIRPLLLLKRD